MPKTLFGKIWDAHEVADGPTSTPPRPRGDIAAGVRGAAARGALGAPPGQDDATADHNVPTDGTPAARLIRDELSRVQVETLERNCEEFGVPICSLGSDRQGIVHVIGPELGLTQPWSNGGARRQPHLDPRRVRRAGIADRDVRGRARAGHRCLIQRADRWRDQPTQVSSAPASPQGPDPGDDRQVGHGRDGPRRRVHRAADLRLSMEGRMTICNMTIEGGGRAGMIAPDDTTFEWVRARPAPDEFDAAVERWAAPPTRASFDQEVEIDAGAISPMVTWGTTPGMVVQVTDAVPNPGARHSRRSRGGGARAPTWRSSPGPRCGRFLSIACSSGRARTRGSGTCARRRAWSTAAGWRTRSARWSSRDRHRSRWRPSPRGSTRCFGAPAFEGARRGVRCASA